MNKDVDRKKIDPNRGKDALFVISKYIQKIGSFSYFSEEENNSRRLNKRCVFTALIFIILASFVLKYPVEGVQGGIDSFAHHGLTNLILSNGYIPWGVSIFSFFGLYPLSVSSGVHTLMASYSSMASLNLFYLMTPFSFIQSIVAILGMFMAAREFKKDDRFAILSAIIYAGTTRFVHYSHHQIGTRGLFLTILPFILWALFRFLDDINIKKFSFLLLFSIVCLATHRMGLYVIVIVFLLGFGILFHRSTVPLFWESNKKSNLLNYLLIISAIVIIFFSYLYIDINVIQMALRRTPEIFLLGRGFIQYLIALAYNYAKFMGIFTIFVPIGFALIILKDKRNIKETVLILTILMILFMIGGYLYLAPALFGFFSLLIGYSIVFFRDRITKKRLIEIAVISMLVIGIIFPNIMLYRDIDGRYPYWIDDDTTEAGFYLSGSDYNGLRGHHHGRRIDAFTERSYGINLERGYGSLEKFDYSTVELKSIDSLIRTPHNPFTIQDWYWEHHARTWLIKNRIYESNITDPNVEDWIYSHNVRYYIMHTITEERANRVSREWAEREGGMSYSVVYNRYKYFSNDVVSVYWI